MERRYHRIVTKFTDGLRDARKRDRRGILQGLDCDRAIVLADTYYEDLTGLKPDCSCWVPSEREFVQWSLTGSGCAYEAPLPEPTAGCDEAMCAPGCVDVWRGNGICDPECDVEACNFDGEPESELQDCEPCV